jgi:hypothetical protein
MFIAYLSARKSVSLSSRVLARYKAALGNTDWVVKNPELQPTKLARRYVQELLKLGVGTQIDHVRSVADIPDNWAYRVYTVIDVTPLRKPVIRVSFRLNVAQDGDASGDVILARPNNAKSVSKGHVDHVIEQMGHEAVDMMRARLH